MVGGNNASSMATLFVDPSWASAGSSVLSEKGRAFKHRVDVQALHFPSWLANNTVAKARRRRRAGPVILKMDVEGAEYGILRELVGSGLMCSRIHAFVIEWHRKKLDNTSSVPSAVDATLEWLLADPGVECEEWLAKSSRRV